MVLLYFLMKEGIPNVGKIKTNQKSLVGGGEVWGGGGGGGGGEGEGGGGEGRKEREKREGTGPPKRRGTLNSIVGTSAPLRHIGRRKVSVKKEKKRGEFIIRSRRGGARRGNSGSLLIFEILTYSYGGKKKERLLEGGKRKPSTPK